MKYSFNQNKDGVFFANLKDVNASFKDLGAVCDSIRYMNASLAIDILDAVIDGKMPILYRTHNKHMGARHELGGRKGRWPGKCAAVVKKALVNAMANASNNDMDPNYMYVVHAAANKTMIAGRGPSQGALFVTGGPSGQVPSRRSDLEFARVEIGVAALDEKRMSPSMLHGIKAAGKNILRLPKKAAKKTEKEKKAEKKAEKKPIITKANNEQKKQEPQQKPQQKPQQQTQPQSQPQQQPAAKPSAQQKQEPTTAVTNQVNK